MGRLGIDESNVQKLVKAKSLLSNLYTAQCCIFNNFSMVKHRHQFWDWISISVFKVEITKWPWILPQFTSIIRKIGTCLFSRWILGFLKKIIFQSSFPKKINFYIYKNLSESTQVFQNFKSYIFAFLIFFLITSFHSVLLHLSFFLMKFFFFRCCQKFIFHFFVKPWQLCQPPQTKVLIWVKANKMVNFSK